MKSAWKDIYKTKPYYQIEKDMKYRVLFCDNHEILCLGNKGKWRAISIKYYPYDWRFPSWEPEEDGLWFPIDKEKLDEAKVVSGTHAQRIINDCYKCVAIRNPVKEDSCFINLIPEEVVK